MPQLKLSVFRLRCIIRHRSVHGHGASRRPCTAQRLPQAGSFGAEEVFLAQGSANHPFTFWISSPDSHCQLRKQWFPTRLLGRVLCATTFRRTRVLLIFLVFLLFLLGTEVLCSPQRPGRYAGCDSFWSGQVLRSTSAWSDLLSGAVGPDEWFEVSVRSPDPLSFSFFS